MAVDEAYRPWNDDDDDDDDDDGATSGRWRRQKSKQVTDRSSSIMEKWLFGGPADGRRRIDVKMARNHANSAATTTDRGVWIVDSDM